MAPPRKSERLASFLALEKSAEIEEEHLNPYVLRRLCEFSDERMIRGDRDCLRIARLCCRIAARLEHDAALARSFGRLASALRLAGRLAHAERALQIALESAPDRLRGDLLRRRCYLRVYQNRLEEAQADAERSITASAGAERAQAVGALGVVFYYREDYRAAIRKLEQCVADTDPDAERAYCNAIQNYATALAEGTVEEMRAALKLCAMARRMLNRRHKMQRAKLWWTEGLLHLRLRHLKKAWRALDMARRSLIALEAAPEVAAITADMVRVLPQPHATRQLCHEAARIISGRHPLTGPLQVLARSAPEWLADSAAALRREASNFAPCPAL